MSYLLGVDTGGTYTDAVILDEGENRILGKAKALTSRHDLTVGIGKAVDAALAAAGIAASDVVLVSLSTTLATNALVEGQGARVALVFIGFDAGDLGRGGLIEALKGDPVLHLAGGHTHAGTEALALDMAALESGVHALSGDVSGFAVASRFATRNPAHEIAARDLIRRVTGRPVTCSHELSANLNGPKRALTAVLNARLIGMIDRLVAACERHLSAAGIDAPLMVVRGDGALISAAMVRERPIETILSGPAASIVGARWLTGASDALVSDIGGTTTDVALLRGGLPEIDPEGARVGGFRTMVEAVAMRTTGLGGDSELHLVTEGLKGGLRLGPRRLVPVSLLALDHGEMVHAALDRWLSNDAVGEMDGRFVVPMGGQRGGLTARDLAVLDRIDRPIPMAEALTSRLEVAALERLVARGLVMLSGVTPSDAAHVLGRLEAWDTRAAEKALRLIARRRSGAGERFATGPEPLAEAIVDQLTAQTVDGLLEAAFGEDPAFADEAPEALARHRLARAGLDQHRGVVEVGLRLGVPVIGLGASAQCYYGAVGERLGCRMILPEHAGVANAIGAVAGQVTQRVTALVSSVDRAVNEVEIEGRLMFIEAQVTATASGRPRVARR